MYVIEINSITRVNNLRNKRLLDVVLSFLLLAFSPLLFIFMKRPHGFIWNILRVLSGNRTWVGYSKFSAPQNLPPVRKGILNPTDALNFNIPDTETTIRLNMLYARDYRLSSDINIILKGFRNLGRKA